MDISSVTEMILEINFIIFYNIDTRSKTVCTSPQVTLEIGQMFLRLKILHCISETKKSDLLKLCRMIKVINEGVCAPG